MKSIAVLITVHNRKAKTLACLEHLFAATLPGNHSLEIFLVDDGSTDGTGEAVKEQFPQVNVIQGTGDLFWNRGMRLAWETASKVKAYNFYIWLNDDTILDKNALQELFESYNELLIEKKMPAIITGACRESSSSDTFSYGGRDNKGPVIPNYTIQTCKYINGNIVLVPKGIFEKLGNLSNDYTHIFGDHDYGLRAIQSGFTCYTTKTYIATCPTNKGIPAWCDPKTPLRRRWKLFHSPKGLNIKDYSTYKRKFWGAGVIVPTLKAYLRMLFPKFYHNVKLRLQ